jgi:excisionase family DNA binding protein
MRGMKITLTVKEVAGLLGVSTDCVYAMVREKQVEFVRVRRRILFHHDVIDAWLRGKKT